MKKFITRLLLFCMAPLAVLLPLGYVVDTGLHKTRYFFYAEWNDLFNGKANADVLIMGSSRAWVHFSPQILDSMLGVNSYNMGLDGAPFYVQYQRFKIYMRYNKKPKYVIQEVAFNITFSAIDQLPYYQQFLPYLYDSTIWTMVKKAYPSMNVVDRYFPLYKYNNQIPLVKEGVWSYMGKGKPAVKYKGFQAQDWKWDSSFAHFKKINPGGFTVKIDSCSATLFGEYLEYCKANDIKVIMVYAPIYYEVNQYVKNHNEVYALLNGYSNTYDVPLLDYTKRSVDSNINYFYNSLHMNRQGTTLFNYMLGEDLKKYIH